MKCKFDFFYYYFVSYNLFSIVCDAGDESFDLMYYNAMDKIKNMKLWMKKKTII